MSNPIKTGVTLKKRVVLAVTNDLVTDNRVNKVALSLLEMGFDVTLTGRDYPSGKEKLNRPYQTNRFHLWFNKGPQFYANYNIRLFFYLISKRFDVIVSNDLDTLPACYLASKWTKKPLVYDSHEYYTEVPELVDRPLVKRCWEKIEKRILPNVKHCYTVCQSIADVYNGKYGNNFQVIRNLPSCVDLSSTENIEPKFPTDKPVIIYQGAVNLGRGVEEAILSMHQIENVNLVIAGGGDMLEKCKALAEKEQLTDRIFFLGRFGFNDLKQITRHATIGISVEKDLGLNYRFALPNKLFDYIQSEVPVLSASLPEMKRVIDQYGVGITIKETTPDAIAEGIKLMLAQKEQYQNWKANCKKAKEILCWENESLILKSIYDKFL